MKLSTHHLLGLECLTAEDISLILDTAVRMKQEPPGIEHHQPLAGKTVINLFHEPSTRTRTSFELAGKRLGAQVINFGAGGSSLAKGESLKDTFLTLQALAPHIIVLRHSAAGMGHFLSQHISASLINAGDGAHEHPTQALLDMLTMRDHYCTLHGLTVAIVGDITHSRVARSNIRGLTTMGATVRVAGPVTMLPPHIDRMGATAFLSVDEAISDADVIMCLRIQRERMDQTLLPSLKEYSRFFGVTEERLRPAKKEAMIMHPGPLNRGVEISSAVADGDRSFILKQVTNGLAVRMALFYLLAGEGDTHAAH